MLCGRIHTCRYFCRGVACVDSESRCQHIEDVPREVGGGESRVRRLTIMMAKSSSFVVLLNFIWLHAAVFLVAE